MKLTELKIAPQNSWGAVGDNNPLICTVNLASDHATVQTALHADQIAMILDLVQRIVAEAAQRNVADFVAQVTALEAQKKIGAQ